MNQPSVFCWISLGSNHDRHQQISRALDALYEAFGTLIISQVYETQPVGIKVTRCAPFYNLVAGFFTYLQPNELNLFLKSVEGQQKYLLPEDRSIYVRALDLDLVTWGDACGELDGVQLPYKDLLKHDFVLRPLAELAPEQQVPGYAVSFQHLWQHNRHQEQQMQAVDFTWQGQKISVSDPLQG